MAERFFQIDDNCSLDGSFQLHYGKGTGKVLKPCESIDDAEILIGIVDNNAINPKRLQLTSKDYQPISVTIPESGETVEIGEPGKSGVVFLDTDIEKGMFSRVAERILGNGTDRRDHLHLATVGEIKKEGWDVKWAPLQMSGNLMHARLVPPELDANNKIPDEKVNNLTNLFKKKF